MQVKPTKYRLRMSPIARLLRVTLLSVIAVFFVPGVITAELGIWWRAMSLVGLTTAVLAIRMMVAAVIVVSEGGLRVQKNWPYRRDFSWYRILTVDVIPGFWNLEIELNSGERLELPPVSDINTLYDDIERHRAALDAH